MPDGVAGLCGIVGGSALRGCAVKSRRGIVGGSCPVPDGWRGLRGIVGGYRLMEGRTVAATGNGCGGGSAWHRRRLCASRMRRQAAGHWRWLSASAGRVAGLCGIGGAAALGFECFEKSISIGLCDCDYDSNCNYDYAMYTAGRTCPALAPRLPRTCSALCGCGVSCVRLQAARLCASRMRRQARGAAIFFAVLEVDAVTFCRYCHTGLKLSRIVTPYPPPWVGSSGAVCLTAPIPRDVAARLTNEKCGNYAAIASGAIYADRRGAFASGNRRRGIVGGLGV